MVRELWRRETGVVIQVRGLTKRYGGRAVVDGLTFDVPPGQVTGFLGPNGAGKTTTLRMILGLVTPDAGTATVCGLPLRQRSRGLCYVGALLDAADVDGGRTGVAHVNALARSNGMSRRRAEQVLAEVGLGGAAGQRIAGYSLGMRQRLGIAVALLADPPVLLFDEPFNGLDPEGVSWLRDLLGRLAGSGRAVFVSSHLMAEMQSTADRVIVIGRGRLIAAETVTKFSARLATDVLVRASEPDRLAQALNGEAVTVAQPDGSLRVVGMSAERIGLLALREQVALSELTPRTASLEDVFMRLTAETVEHRAGRQ